jgi:hypothetical protein
MNAPLLSTLQINEQSPSTTLIDLTPATESRSVTPPIVPHNNDEEHQLTRLKY